MARDFSRKFYNSKQWADTRNAYFESVHGLCERCLRRGVLSAGEIVHHKVHLTPMNIGDPSVSLSFDNLELVCRECHGSYHSASGGDGPKCRVAFDEFGNVVRKADDES